MFRRYRSIIIILVAVIMTAGVLAYTVPAPRVEAIPVTVLHDVTTSLRWIYDKVTAALDKANKIVGHNLLNSTVSVVLNQVAYDAANYIAYGGFGQKPLARTKTIGRILSDARDSAYGEFVGGVSEGYFEGLGLDLCQPSVDIQAKISIGIINDVTPPRVKPKCDIKQVQQNWVKFGAKLSSGKWLSVYLSTLGPDQQIKPLGDLFDYRYNDIGAFMILSDVARKKAQRAEFLASLTETECNGYFDQLAGVSEDIVHRCSDIYGFTGDKELEKVIAEQNLIKSDTVFSTVANTFKKTLTAKLFQRFIHATWYPLAQTGDTGKGLRDSLIAKLRGNVDLRRDGTTTDLIANIQTVDPTSVNNFEYLDDLATCPPDKNIGSQQNCTLDANFLAAVNNKETVFEAIGLGHLNPNWPLVSYLNAAVNGDKKCYQNAYCYSNIAKLRSYRILPLGWEIAAALSPVERPITLGEAIACFENGSGCLLDPGKNIFYHLIDPSWVLTAPVAQCKALVNGPNLEDVSSNQRQQVCVDRPSCLAEDSKGNCIGGYGYCTQEQNIWRFTGQQCQEQYASCEILVRRDNGAKYGFLKNTLEPCDASQAGCQWYSRSQENIGTDDNPVYVWNPSDRIYFNNKVASCPQEFAGCQEFINPLQPGVNLLTNGNFTDFQANSATDYNDDNWQSDNKPDDFSGWVGNGDNLKTLTTAVDAQIGSIGLRLEGDGQMSTSAPFGGLAGATFTLSWYGKAQTDCVAQGAIGSLSTPAITANVNYTTGWKRYQLTHTFEANNPDQIISVFLQSAASCGALFIDGVKVELGSKPTSFSDYGDNGKIYLNGGRASCKQEDIGCSLYTPINGDPAVPGVVSQNDYCPAECVGYQTYIQLPTNFELLENSNASSQQVNFIAKTALKCPATQVGCSEFTNLDEVAAGGEGKYYYSYLRQCVEASRGVTYYTLEGSDTSGFQVKTWQILKSNLPNFNGPCTTIDIGGNTCTDTIVSDAICTAADMTTNPNCREFFDTDGLSYFRLQDKVIFASSDCHPFRRTDGGQVYNGTAKDSHSCSDKFVGCSEYRGNQSNNLRLVVGDTFESGSYDPWKATGSAVAAYSAEAVSQGGHSLAVTAPGVMRRPVANKITAGREYYFSFWLKNAQPNTDIRVGLGVGSDTTATSDDIATCSGASCWFDTISVPVATDWQLYNVGPLLVDSVTDAANMDIAVIPSAAVFMDNIYLKESISHLFAVRNSWTTPASCDQPFAGANLGCQSYKGSDGKTYNLRSFSHICRTESIGCQAIINTQNSDSPFSKTYHSGDKSQVVVPADNLEYVVVSKNNSCSASYQGCSLMGQPGFNRDLPPQDPNYVREYTPVYLINDPDTYDRQLCLDSGLFCQEYSNDHGGAEFYRDPYNRTCSYKEGLTINGQVFSGWFRTTSLEPGKTPVGCYAAAVPTYSPSEFTIHKFVDSKYDAWVGTCPAGQNQCSEFIDTQATEGPNRLLNPDFAANKTNWASWEAGGNKLAPNSDALFDVNVPRPGTATVRTNPTGTGLFFQRIFTNLSSNAISNGDTYSLSADVNIKKFFPDDRNRGGVQAALRCFWDSPYDTDYCGTLGPDYGVAPDFNRKCTSNADCTGGPNDFCYKQTPYYCESATDKTMIVCQDDSRCNTAAGYHCRSAGYESTETSTGLRRDHLAEYAISADINVTNKTQYLNVVANIGAQSQGDELVYCEPTFRIYSGYPNGNPACTPNDDNNPACFNTACTGDGTSCNPPTASCNSVNNSCGGQTEVEFTNVSLRQSKSYFYINNKSIDDSSCNGQVSKKNGCILFDDTNEPQKLYNSYLTYVASENAGSNGVSPVVCDPNSSNNQLRNCTNDANRIIKVDRDRECAQWLACKSSSQIFDPQNNSYRQICSEVGLCDKYTSNGSVLNCAEWLAENNTKLDYSRYVSRDTRYEAVDYAGMSLFNRYAVDGLKLVDISNNATPTTGPSGPDLRNPDWRLVKTVSCPATLPACIDPNGSGEQYGKLGCGPNDVNGQPLGKVFGSQNNGICALGIDGSRFDPSSPFVVKSSSRGYAEIDAPFPKSVVAGDTGQDKKIKFGFQQANVCDSKVASCEPGYYKMQYGVGGSRVKYYAIGGPLGGVEVPTCVCDGGNLDGSSCRDGEDPNDSDNIITAEDSCPGGGNPTQLRRSESFLNWPGYCLEPDLRTSVNGASNEFACLSWLPVDISPSGTDYFNLNREAGYSYKTPAYYCLETRVVEERRPVVTECMSLNNVSKRYDLVKEDGTFISDWGGQYTHGAWVLGGSSKCGNTIPGILRGPWLGAIGGIFSLFNKPKANWIFYPIAVGRAEENGLVLTWCVNDPNLLGYFNHGDRGRLYYTEYCLANYDGSTSRIKCADKDNCTDSSVQNLEEPPFSQCSYLAQAVDTRGNNAAVTNLFWSDYNLGRGYQLQVSAASSYSIKQDDTPFGAAVPSSGLEPEDLPALAVKKAGEIPRAGAPYACTNDRSICNLIGDSSGIQKTNGLYIDSLKGVTFDGNEDYADGMDKLRSIYKHIFGIYQYNPGATCGNYCNGGILGGQGCDISDPKSCKLDSANKCQTFANKCVNSLRGAISCQGCPTGFSLNGNGACVSTNVNGALGCLTQCNPHSSQGWVCKECADPETCDAFTGPDCSVGNCRCVSPVGCPSGFSENANGICVPPASASFFSCFVQCTSEPGFSCKKCALDSCTSSSVACTGAESSGCSCVGPAGPVQGQECDVKLSDVTCKKKADFDWRCRLSNGTWLPVACRLGLTSDCQSTTEDSSYPIEYDDNLSIFQGTGAVNYINQQSFCGAAGSAYCTGTDFNTSGLPNYLDSPFDCSQPFTNNLGQVIDPADSILPANPGDNICNLSGACKKGSELTFTDTSNGSTRPFCVERITIYKPLCDPDSDKLCVPNCSTVVGNINPPYSPVCNPNSIVEQALPLDSTPSRADAKAKADSIPGITATQVTTIGTRPAVKYNGLTSGGASNFGPVLYESVCDQNSGKCKLGSSGNFSINNKISGEIKEDNEPQLFASLTFYALSYKDHMPLRYIDVDWGDGSRLHNVGYYKNNWPNCDPKEASSTPATWGAMDFSGTSQGCDQSIRTYFHLYRYQASHDGNFGCPVGYACYKPAVQLQDNWGWCTNNVWGDVGLGCSGGTINFGGNAGGIIKIKKPTA